MSYEQAKSLTLRGDNRLINHQHVLKILKKVVENIDAIPCIRVNIRTNHIIDGQHRYKAFIKAIEDGLLPPNTQLRVEFVDIPEDEEVAAIIESNINSKNWMLEDYINLYIKQGVSVYTKLGEWCKAHALAFENGKPKYRYGAAIITGKHSCAPIKNGVFSITDEELQEADGIHAELMNIIDVFELPTKGTWIEGLAVAWHAHRGMHPYKEWLSNIKRMKNRLKSLPKGNETEWNNIFAQVHTSIDKRNNAA